MEGLEDEVISPPILAYVCMTVGMLTTFLVIPVGLIWLAIKWWGKSGG